MTTFWSHGVRLPALVLGGTCIATGAAGVADWSIALAAALPFALAAQVAARAHQAAVQRRRAIAAAAAPAPYRFITPVAQPPAASSQDRAA